MDMTDPKSFATSKINALLKICTPNHSHSLTHSLHGAGYYLKS